MAQAANLAVTTPQRVKYLDAKPNSRALVRAAAANLAPKITNAAKRTGEVVLAGAAKGKAIAANQARRGSRAVVRAARENWRSIAVNEGLGLGSHALTFFLDKKAKQTYLRALEGSKILQWLVTPSNLLTAMQMVGLAFSKGNVRKFIREAMRGTLHAKVGDALHSMFPESTPAAANAPAAATAPQRKGKSKASGAEDEPDDASGADDEPDDASGADDEPDDASGAEDEPDDASGADDETDDASGAEDEPDERAG